MKCRLQSFVLSFTTAFALTFFLFSAASAQTSYTAEDIGALNPGLWSTGYAVNAYGDVTGAASGGASLPFRAFLYQPSSGVTGLGTLGGSFSLGTAINASDEVTGYSTIYPGVGCDFNPPDGGPPYCDTYHAFLYTPSGGMKDLETLGGSFSAGTGINASGQVVGSSMTSEGYWHAFLYSGGVMKDLGTLDGQGSSYAFGINDSGDVVGISNGRPFLYNGKMSELNVPGTPLAINNFRQITGSGAFLYKDGTTTDLGGGVGQSINNFSQVVGNNDLAPEDLASKIGQIEFLLFDHLYPFLYTPGSGVVALSSLVQTCYPYEGFCVPPLIDNANGINDVGQIAGEAVQPGIGNPFAFLFSPVTSSFSPFQAKLQITGKGETHFHLTGSFTLGTDSTGLDPLTQNVLLQLGSLPIPIQKGLFKQASNGEYVFQGVLGAAAVDFRIKPVTSTSFEFRVQGRTATPFRVTNPARFILMIGNNQTMGTLPWK